MRANIPSARKVYPLIILLFGLIASEKARASDNKETIDPFRQNSFLARGINLGNALEAPKDEDWGVTLKEQYFQLIKDAGFNSVRIPIRWSAYALMDEPFTIEQSFFERVDWAIESAFSKGLYVVLNIHHYQELYDDPIGHKQRYLAIWKQIAEHYKDYPHSLLFEFLNEPCKNLKADIWNQLIKETLTVIRKSNPKRTVVIGPVNWNSVDSLDKLELPNQDRNIIVTFHYYSPFKFTHQGAVWAGEHTKQWIGTKWTGSDEEKKAVIEHFDKASEWSKTNNRPIYIGEFGAYKTADMASRTLWTEFIARQGEKRGFSWAYWEFCAGFGAYDRSRNDWNYPLLNALIPPKNKQLLYENFFLLNNNKKFNLLS